MKRDPRIFALFCVLLGGMGQGVVAPKLPELLRAADGIALASGVSATLMYLGVFVSTFRYGRWADEGRVHWLLGPGLFAYAATLVALGVVVDPLAIYGLRFVEGLALSAIYVATDFMLGRLSPQGERGQWLGYYGVALSIGLVLGPAVALVAPKLAIAAGVSAELASKSILPLALVAAVAAACAAFALNVRVDKLPGDAEAPAHPPMGPLFSGAAYGFMEAGLVAVFPVLAVWEFFVTPEYCLFAVILAAAVSSVVWGTLSDKVGPRLIVLALLAALVFGPALFVFSAPHLTREVVAFTSAIFFGVLAGGMYPVGFAWLLKSLPESQYGYASGSFARAYGMGSLVGPLACGIAAQLWGSRGLFAALALMGLVALVAVLARSRLKPPSSLAARS